MGKFGRPVVRRVGSVFHSEVPGQHLQMFCVRAVDARGRQVTSGNWLVSSSSFEAVLDLNGLENGLYRLSFIANGIPSSIQLVKAH